MKNLKQSPTKLIQGTYHFLFILLSLICLSNPLHSQINFTELNDTIVGPGNILKDLDADGTFDYNFEIITLPIGELAVRVVSMGTSTFLDNSTFGYPDTLNTGDAVDGFFNSGNGVLGTFNDAGQFKGAGNKYLGLRLNTAGNYQFGWMYLNCSVGNDTLILISCAYHSVVDEPITAGEVDEMSAVFDREADEKVSVFPNPAIDWLYVTQAGDVLPTAYSITAINGQLLKNNVYNSSIDISELESGVYILLLHYADYVVRKKFVVSH